MAAMTDNQTIELTPERAMAALRDILAAFSEPDNMRKIDDAKETAGNDMLKYMQFVFPVSTQIEMEVIQHYGFAGDGEGLIQFAQAIREIEVDHPEIGHLNSEVRSHLIPMMMPPSPPSSL